MQVEPVGSASQYEEILHSVADCAELERRSAVRPMVTGPGGTNVLRWRNGVPLNYVMKMFAN